MRRSIRDEGRDQWASREFLSRADVFTSHRDPTTTGHPGSINYIAMGIIKKTFYTGVLTGAGLLGYLGTTTTLTSPLPRDDPIWRSRTYAKYNVHGNASMHDVVTKRIPLDKIKPELLQKEGGVVLELCRGVWGGLGELHFPALCWEWRFG